MKMHDAQGDLNQNNRTITLNDISHNISISKLNMNHNNGKKSKNNNLSISSHGSTSTDLSSPTSSSTPASSSNSNFTLNSSHEQQMSRKYKQNNSNSKLNSHLIFYNNSIEHQQQPQQNIQNNLGLLPLHQTNNYYLQVPIISNDGTIINDWYMQCKPDSNNINQNNNTNTNNNNNNNNNNTTTTTSATTSINQIYFHARTPIFNYHEK